MSKTKKLIIGIICLVLAAATVFLVVPLMAQLTANKAEVIILSQDVQKGKTITEEDLSVAEVSMNNIRADIAKKEDMNSVVGQFALVDLKKGDFVTGEKVGATTNESDQAIAALPDGKEAYSIKFTGLEASVSSKIKDGDIVCCYVTDRVSKKTFTDEKLRYLKVLTCTDSSGTDTGNKVDTSEKKKISQTLTLSLTPDQIASIATYERSSDYSISFSIVFRGSNVESEKFIRMQDDILSNSKE